MSSYIHRVFTICHVYSAQLYVPFLKANLGQAVQEKIGENRCHHTQFHNCDPNSSFLHFNSLWVSLWSCWLGPPLTTLPFPTTPLKHHLIFILPVKSHSSHFIEKELGSRKVRDSPHITKNIRILELEFPPSESSAFNYLRSISTAPLFQNYI